MLNGPLDGALAPSPTLLSWSTGVGASSTPANPGTDGVQARSTDGYILLVFTPTATPAPSSNICNILWAGGNGSYPTRTPLTFVNGGNRASAVQASTAAGVAAIPGPNGITLQSGTTALTAGQQYVFLLHSFGGL